MLTPACTYLALACLAAFTLAMPAAGAAHRNSDDPPPIFAKLSFDKALAESKGSGRILVVKATAAWCGPCKMMDKTTWRDETVVDWFKANGTAIQFDVDEQRDLAANLKIQAMPTMIAFVKGEEFDRVVGYKSAEDLLAWADGVKRGEKSIEKVRRRADRARGGEAEVDARYDLARNFVQSGEMDKATEEYAWLWVNSEGVPGYGGVRGSFMASDMKRLAAQHAPARERFTAFRDAAGEKLAADKVDHNDLDDWVVLNDVVGEPEKTLEWFDRVKKEPRWGPLVERVGFRLERLLMERERWADIALVYRSPVARLRQDHEMWRMAEASQPPEGAADHWDEMKATQARMFRDKAGKLHAAMLAGKREDDARKLADEALKLDDSGPMRRTLVEWALKAGQPRPYHADLLKAAEERAEDVESLHARLAEQLRNR